MPQNRMNAMRALLVLLIAIGLPGCGYPDVSPKTYELAKALYSACNRQSEEQLARVVELIETTNEAGEISDREAKWLTAIVDQADAGEWEQAMSEARQLLEDQSTR